MMIKHRRSNALKINSQVRELGSTLSFLDVLRDACAHNGRYTLTAESNGQVYTVLVDRGGPFNAIGGGTAGPPALVAAAQVRSGRCSVTIGWPVDQPLYQPGLDMTLRALVEGAVAPSSLPRHRGVDTLRNAEWREMEVAPAVTEMWKAQAAPPIIPVVDVQASPGPVAPDPIHPTAQVPKPAPVEPPASEAPPLPVATHYPTRPWIHTPATMEPEGAVPAATRRTDDVLPAGVRAGAAVASAKHFATQALLWLCEVEEPEDYTFEQAAALARHNLFEGIAQGLHPFRRDMRSRIDKVKHDWARSGEVAARTARKKRGRAVVSVDPDDEFRLF